MSEENSAEIAGDRAIEASRIFDAPREIVFKAWTDREHIGQWWGPNGFKLTIHEMDVRPGGAWRFVMHGPDGRNFKNENVYVEIVEPERIIMDHVSPPRYRMTAVFADLGGRTRIDVQTVFESAQLRDVVVKEHNAVEGLAQTLGRLAEHLAIWSPA